MIGFVFAVSPAAAQSVPGVESRGGLPAAASPPDNDASAAVPSAAAPKRPGVREARPGYPSNPANYPSSPPRLRTQKLDPNSAAAQRQTGLTQTDAANLMSGQGYTHIGDVRADPNSIWVWEADALKNGRRVRLGVDYRGNLLELSNAPPQPCTSPEVGFGAGPMGVGSRLSEATSCASR